MKKSIEDKYVDYLTSNIEVPDIKNRVKSQIQFKKKEGIWNMLSKKWIIGLSTVASIAVVTGIVIGVCSYNITQSNKPTSVVCLDLNNQTSATKNNKKSLRKDNESVVINQTTKDEVTYPSIELIVNANNKVVSVRGLNDEGKLIVYGEKLEDLEINSAVKLIIELETKAGYLQTKVDASNNEVSVSVTGESSSEKLENDLVTYIKEQTLYKDVNANVKAFNEYSEESFNKYVLSCDPTLSEEQVKNMSNEDKMKVIEKYYEQTANLYETKFENFYNQYREDFISSKEYQDLENVIKNYNPTNLIEAVYQTAVSAYDIALGELKTFYSQLDKVYYSSFVDPESDYQLALKELNNTKDDIVKYRQKINELEDKDSSTYNGLITYLNTLERGVDNQVYLLNALENAGQTALDVSKNKLNGLISNLETLRKALPNSLHDEIAKSKEATQKALEEAKNESKEEFNKEYEEEIKASKQRVEERKNKLMNK